MAGIDVNFVQELVDFGKGLAGEMVGQPFQVYRLRIGDTGNVLDPSHVVHNEVRAKITHNKSSAIIENEYLHTNPFEFVMDASKVRVGDMLMQLEPVDPCGCFVVASKRPLKPVVGIRVEDTCYVTRTTAGAERGYGGTLKHTESPFVLRNGCFELGTADVDAPAELRCGVISIGQMKNQKPTHLPMDVITSWWFIYLPPIPGLVNRIRENDIVTVLRAHPDEPDTRYRVTIPYTSRTGLAGCFLVAERL